MTKTFYILTKTYITKDATDTICIELFALAIFFHVIFMTVLFSSQVQNEFKSADAVNFIYIYTQKYSEKQI